MNPSTRSDEPPSKGWYVDVPAEVFNQNQRCLLREQNPCRIWTRKFEKVRIPDLHTLGDRSTEKLPTIENDVYNVDKEYLDENETALVMVHGLGAGGALFALNFDGLAKHFTVYSIDLPGNKYSSWP